MSERHDGRCGSRLGWPCDCALAKPAPAGAADKIGARIKQVEEEYAVAVRMIGDATIRGVEYPSVWSQQAKEKLARIEELRNVLTVMGA